MNTSSGRTSTSDGHFLCSFTPRRTADALLRRASSSSRVFGAGIYNASYHRLQLIASDRTAIKLDYGRQLRAAYERAQRLGQALPIAVCIGTDLAVHYAAATMGALMPESADELAVAGGLRNEPIAVTHALTQDLIYPAETEIVLEGLVWPVSTVREGPFGEFVGYI